MPTMTFSTRRCECHSLAHSDTHTNAEARMRHVPSVCVRACVRACLCKCSHGPTPSVCRYWRSLGTPCVPQRIALVRVLLGTRSRFTSQASIASSPYAVPPARQITATTGGPHTNVQHAECQPAKRGSSGSVALGGTGRVWTQVFFYLMSTEKGGETSFPKANNDPNFRCTSLLGSERSIVLSEPLFAAEYAIGSQDVAMQGRHARVRLWLWIGYQGPAQARRRCHLV